MLIFILTVILILIAIYLVSIDNEQTPPNTKRVPSENGWPIVGVIFRMNPSSYVYFHKLKERLGPIFQVKVGMQKTIVLNDINYFKKCFKEKGNIFGVRHAESILKLTSKNAGVLFTNGKLWANSRSFTLRVLRDFGLGKLVSQEIIKNEANHLIEELLTYSSDSIVNFEDMISVYILNVITKFTMNKRYEQNDKDMVAFRDFLHSVIDFNEPIQLLEMMFPFLEHWDWYKKLSLYMFKYTDTFDKLHVMFEQEVKLHEKLLNNKTEPEDLMDRFIMERNKYSEDEIPPEFKEFQLIRLALELYGAGFDTSSNSLVWALLILAYYPEIQEKLYNEIHEKIGVERMPNMSDKKNMPYTQAVLDDIMRLSSTAPMGLLHRTSDSCVIDDYHIPKDILVIPNIYSCHRDRRVWKKPYALYPEHFLTENGEYQPRDELVFFGMGKRQCLGEGLARMEFFIFVIHIIQTFRVELPRKITEETFQKYLIGHDCIIRPAGLGEFRFFKR